MSEELEESVEQEIATAAAPAEESNGAEEVQKAEAFAKKSQDDQDRNWKEARRKMQELEAKVREQDELIKRQSAPTPAKEDDELDKLGRDDIITYGQVDKLIEKRAEKIAQKIMQQSEASTVDVRLQMKYPDFAQVVTKENIELLKETEPELAESLRSMADPMTQGVAAYKLLKKTGIGETEEVAKLPPKEKQKAIQNGQKPVSVNTVTKQSAIGNAHIFENGLTPELKAALQKEMKEAAKYA